MYTVSPGSPITLLMYGTVPVFDLIEENCWAVKNRCTKSIITSFGESFSFSSGETRKSSPRLGVFERGVVITMLFAGMSGAMEFDFCITGKNKNSWTRFIVRIEIKIPNRIRKIFLYSSLRSWYECE